MLRWTAALVVLVWASGCVGEPADPAAPQEPSPSAPPGTPASNGPFGLRSSAFAPGEPIPSKYTCDGENVSPPLEFENVPPNPPTFALIMEDPDAPSGTVLHWSFWNLPSNVTTLDEAADLGEEGARQGQTYRGPCPPVGEHRYFFYAFAVDRALELAEGSGVEELRSALEGHTVAESEMFGTYFRPQLPPIR